MPKFMVFIPAYNCSRQIGRVINQFTPAIRELFGRVVVIDNRSTDGTLEAARAALGAWQPEQYAVLRNHENYGLGGSHKVAFNYALEHGFSHLVVLHGDDQGSIADLVPYLRSGAYRDWDGLLGARFLPESKLPGYSRLRTFLNHTSNLVFTAITGRRVHDLGAGLNLYRVDAFADRTYLNFVNSLSFNQVLLLYSIDAGHRLQFFPLTWREDDQISNARLARMGVQFGRLVASYVFDRRRLFSTNHGGRPVDAYAAEVMAGYGAVPAPGSVAAPPLVSP